MESAHVKVDWKVEDEGCAIEQRRAFYKAMHCCGAARQDKKSTDHEKEGHSGAPKHTCQEKIGSNADICQRCCMNSDDQQRGDQAECINGRISACVSHGHHSRW